MEKAESPPGKMRITSPEDEGGGCFTRLLSVTVVIVVILLAAIWVIARLDGFRTVLEDYLSEKLAMEMSVSEARIGWPYVLVIEDAVSGGFEKGDNGGIKVRQMRIGLTLNLRMKITVKKGELKLVKGNGNEWFPEIFKRVGAVPWSRLDEISRATGITRKDIELHVEDGSIRWFSGQGNSVLSMVEGLCFHMSPADVPGKDMYHYSVSVYRSVHPGGVGVNGIGREWLASDEIPYIEIDRSGPGAPSAVTEFWNPDRGKSAL